MLIRQIINEGSKDQTADMAVDRNNIRAYVSSNYISTSLNVQSVSVYDDRLNISEFSKMSKTIHDSVEKKRKAGELDEKAAKELVSNLTDKLYHAIDPGEEVTKALGDIAYEVLHAAACIVEAELRKVNDQRLRDVMKTYEDIMKELS